MITEATLTTFFGWCAVINIGLMLIGTIFSVLLHGIIVRMHGRMFHLEEADISRALYHFLGQYKTVTLVFSVVPYLALKIMG